MLRALEINDPSDPARGDAEQVSGHPVKGPPQSPPRGEAERDRLDNGLLIDVP